MTKLTRVVAVNVTTSSAPVQAVRAMRRTHGSKQQPECAIATHLWNQLIILGVRQNLISNQRASSPSVWSSGVAHLNLMKKQYRIPFRSAAFYLRKSVRADLRDPCDYRWLARALPGDLGRAWVLRVEHPLLERPPDAARKHTINSSASRRFRSPLNKTHRRSLRANRRTRFGHEPLSLVGLPDRSEVHTAGFPDGPRTAPEPFLSQTERGKALPFPASLLPSRAIWKRSHLCWRPQTLSRRSEYHCTGLCREILLRSPGDSPRDLRSKHAFFS